MFVGNRKLEETGICSNITGWQQVAQNPIKILI
jgi:hypothetical protein